MTVMPFASEAMQALNSAEEATARIINRVPIFNDVADELDRAAKHGDFNNAHEGYAVLLEEVDELKDHVWMRQDKRNLAEMRKEAIQVAAMAMKFVAMIDAGKGR